MMHYAICNETFQGWDWESVCRQVAACGYNSIEVAPFTFADDVRNIDTNERQKIRATAQKYGLAIVGLHWLLVSPKGLSITDDNADTRCSTSDYITELVKFCADLGGKNMILGSPAQRRLPTTDGASTVERTLIAVDRLTEVLKAPLNAANGLGITICLEPLPAPEADFVLTLAEAVDIVMKLDHPNLRTMLDVKSASSETEPIDNLIRRFHPLIKHVHVNDENRRGPGFGDTDFVPIMAALRACAYAGPISVEVFDYSPDPVTIAQKSLDYLINCSASDLQDQSITRTNLT